VGKVKKPLPETVAERRASSDRRNKTDRRVQSVPVEVERRKIERRVKVSRRRQIDPTTCERDYTPAEIEFMGALDEYKRSSGRMFPTCSEVLEVLLKLGYEKRPPQPTPELAAAAEAIAAPEGEKTEPLPGSGDPQSPSQSN
jgi:hypothetical protein